MQIQKEVLLKALEIVRPGLANKPIIEQTTAFAFIDGRVVTYNDEISLSHPIPELADIRGAIEADQLYKFLSKIKADDKGNIDLSMNEDHEIVVKSGRSKAGLTLQAEITLPLQEEDFVERYEWAELPEDFTKFLGIAMSSCGKDMSKAILTCVHINEEGFIEGADNYRFTFCSLSDKLLCKTFLLPATSAVNVVKIDPIEIAEGKGWIHFRNSDDTIISCRIMADKYPDTREVFEIKGKTIILPSSTGQVLDRAMIFSKRDHALDESVDVSIADRILKVRAESDSGWFEEEVNIKYTDDPVTFRITPYLLKSILSETTEFTLSNDKSRLKFQGEGWEYVTLLRR